MTMVEKFNHIRKLWNGYINTLKGNQDSGIQVGEPTLAGFKVWLTYNATEKDVESVSYYYEIIVDCWMGVSMQSIAEKLNTMTYFKQI